jgi:hypothetical protein
VIRHVQRSKIVSWGNKNVDLTQPAPIYSLDQAKCEFLKGSSNALDVSDHAAMRSGAHSRRIPRIDSMSSGKNLAEEQLMTAECIVAMGPGFGSGAGDGDLRLPSKLKRMR